MQDENADSAAVRAPRTPPGRNPVRTERIRDQEVLAEIRRLDCRGYNACLDVAEDWDGFSCLSCGAHDPIDRDDVRRDIEGMAAMWFARTALLKRVPLDD